MINWKFPNKKEAQLTHKIAMRAVELGKQLTGRELDFLDVEMDIATAHLNGNPLKLQELLDADESNFAHDVFGIRRHLNRYTGELQGFFSPRYSQPE